MKKDMVDVKQKCKWCTNKAGTILISCKCNEKVCVKHLSKHNQECIFDYRAENRNRLQNSMPVVVADKLIKI